MALNYMNKSYNVEVLPSALRTADPTISSFTSRGCKGIVLVVNVTAVDTEPVPSVTFTIKGKDSISGKTFTLLASAAVSTTGTKVYRVYPNLTASNNLIANDVLTETWTVTAVHGNAGDITYSIGALLIT